MEPRTKKPLRVVLLISFVLAALVAAGCEFSCGTSNTVSSDELEKQINTAYKGQTGVPLDTISCQEAATDVGSPINCEGSVENIKLRITGTVKNYNADSNRINFDWSAEPTK